LPAIAAINEAWCRLTAPAASFEGELHRCLYRLAVNFQHGIGQEIYRAGSGCRFNHKVPAAAEFEAVGRMAAKVVGCQPRILAALADVNRPPLALGKELRPAMIAVNPTLVPRRDTG
jgi:hypothetical protein